MAPPIKPTPEKYCQCCGKKMERRRSPRGILESVSTFQKRKYCSLSCLTKATNPERIKKRDYSAQTKPDPEKHCEYCGRLMSRKRINGRLEDYGVFLLRKYCDDECMRKAFIRTDGQQAIRQAHVSAQRIAYSILGKEKTCEVCGSQRNIDVHHRDGNWHNNSAENLMVLCRSCHMKIHREKKQ